MEVDELLGKTGHSCLQTCNIVIVLFDLLPGLEHCSTNGTHLAFQLIYAMLQLIHAMLDPTHPSTEALIY